MTIGLIDVDGHNFPNLALMKLSGYHKHLGDDVRWWNGFETYDVVYMSKVFDETYSADVPEPVNAKRVVKGGTGYVRRKDGELQYFVNGDWVSWVSAFSGEIAPCIRYDETLPPEIEHTCPDYGLYPQHTADTACGYLNDESRRLYEDCRLKGTRVTNPLIDWTDADVWQYIHDNHICTNPLYGMGYTRVGCVGCPMAGYVARVNEFARWPKYRQAYLNAFERMLDARRAKGLKSDLWHNADDVMRWWLEDPNVEGQMTMEEIIAEGSEEA